MAAGLLRRLDRALFGEPFGRYYRALERACDGCESILDVGCGAESPVRFFSGRLRRSVGVDLHEPSLEASRRAGIHGEIVRAGVLEIEERFGPKSFDAVVALDVIEHLSKPEGLRLLAQMESLARRRVVVFTPNGFLPQGALEGNELQRHLSGWDTGEMRALGYEVLGMTGWRPLRGEEALPAWRPRFLWERLARWTEPFVRDRPQAAFQLLCVKRLGGA
jgi:SAM-dependent methyltransferase